MTLDAIIDAIGVTPYNRTEYGVLYCADCRDVLPKIPDDTVDLILTDPPYELGFMGKAWDASGIAYNVDMWRFCLDALKPGGYLVAFSGMRTYHRMACAIEDAGFEVRDMIEWVYGSGFPKSLNIGKAVDKINGETGRLLKFVEWYRTTGMKQKETNEIIGKIDVGSHYFRLDQPAIPTRALWEILRPHIKTEIPQWVDELVERIEREREVVGKEIRSEGRQFAEGQSGFAKGEITLTKGTSEWEGWGTALKPAHEPICVARKPLSEKTVAENVLKWGTGGINIDESRVEAQDGVPVFTRRGEKSQNCYRDGLGGSNRAGEMDTSTGRFPANLIHDGSEEVRGCFPDSNGSGRARKLSRSVKPEQQGWGMNRNGPDEVELNDAGSGNASRFFKSIIYQAKASKGERGQGNNHPTVKPIALMEYLAKMFSREGAIVLDPFCGSGSTGCAILNTKRRFIGVEMSPEYAEISKCRMAVDRLRQEELF